MDNQFILTPFFLDEPLRGLEPLEKPGWLLNQPPLSQGTKQARMGALYRPLAELVHQTILGNRRPVSIAGDCCTSIAVLSGLQQAGIEPTLIWFDAHGDFNTWETTPSGFLGGMPLAMLVGRGEQTILEAVDLKPIAESQVMLIDARDLDPGERLAVENSAVTHITNPIELLKDPLPDRPLYIHFDTDILNPTEAPAVNYPAPGGPSAQQLARIFEDLSDSGRVIAVSMSSWNPDLDKDGRTNKVCMQLLNTLIQ